MDPLRLVVASALTAALLGACSFEGAKGSRPADAEEEPDAAVDAAAPDAAPQVVCDASFQRIGASTYKFVDELKDWNGAVSRCRDFQGAHLVTFETLAEVADVKTGLPLTTSVWSSIYQPAGAQTPSGGWVNQLGPMKTAVPQPFPWRPTEPNDGYGPTNTEERGLEDYAELQREGLFDDAASTRLSRVLCECTPSP